MPSLLDNAASGGLLADPRPAILAQLFDMSVKKRPTILSMFTQQNGRIGLTAPQLLVDAVNSAMLPFAAAQGYRATPTDVSKMAMDTMLGGGLLGRAPSGSLAVNVFHGTPHKFAPEPGFPYGRPRLDKMGTGEGAQAYGAGFYTGEAQGVAKTYKAPEGFYKRITGQLDPKTETAFDLMEGGASTSDVMELMLSKYGGDISFDEVIKAIDGARDVGAGQGTLYKLDIPDADAAKMLDWDKPLSQQSKSVQDGLKKAAPTLDIEGRDSVMTGGVFLEKFGGLQDNMRENVARQLSDVGIPGVKYLDQGSRGAGEGSRNYSIWDQDVLDRTKMLERDGVTLGANKSPTAATAGLLSRLPMDEPRRGPKLTQQQFDDVFLSRSKQRQKWGAERKAEREDLIRQVVETQRQRGVNSALGAPPPLREGPREFEDPLLTAAKTREFRAERLRKAKPYADMGQGLWSKSFQKEVNKSAAAPDLFDVESAINRANMEAVPRALKKEGWTIRHASKGRDGRVSSRYLVSPDESYEIRLTDHYLPETAERFHRMTQGQGPRWNDEIVLEGDERPMDIIEQIKSGFKGLLD